MSIHSYQTSFASLSICIMNILLLQFSGLMYVTIDYKLINDYLGVILRRWHVLIVIAMHFNAKDYENCNNN